MRNVMCRGTLAALGCAVMAGIASPALAQGEVNIYSYREPGLIDPLLKAFTEMTGIKVNVVFASAGLNERLAGEIARVMQGLRRMKLAKVPGVAESLDWAAALAALHADHLDPDVVRATLGCIVKEVEDTKRLEADLAAGRLAELLGS